MRKLFRRLSIDSTRKQGRYLHKRLTILTWHLAVWWTASITDHMNSSGRGLCSGVLTERREAALHRPLDLFWLHFHTQHIFIIIFMCLLLPDHIWIFVLISLIFSRSFSRLGSWNAWLYDVLISSADGRKEKDRRSNRHETSCCFCF